MIPIMFSRNNIKMLDLYKNLKNDFKSLDYYAKLYFCTYVDLGLECNCADEKYECIETFWEDSEGLEFVESQLTMLCFNCVQREHATATIGLQISIEDTFYDYHIDSLGRVQPKTTRGHFFSGPIEEWVFRNRPEVLA
jgi:hypothetical protein